MNTHNYNKCDLYINLFYTNYTWYLICVYIYIVCNVDSRSNFSFLRVMFASAFVDEADIASPVPAPGPHRKRWRGPMRRTASENQLWSDLMHQNYFKTSIFRVGEVIIYIYIYTLMYIFGMPQWFWDISYMGILVYIYEL